MKQQGEFVTTVAKTEVTLWITFHFMPSWESQIPNISYMDAIIRVSANCTQSHIMYYIKCAAGLPSPEGRASPLTMSLTHLSSDRDSCCKGAGEAVTPWRSVLRVSLLRCSAGAGVGGALTGIHPDMSDSRRISASLFSHSDSVSLTCLSTKDWLTV